MDTVRLQKRLCRRQGNRIGWVMLATQLISLLGNELIGLLHAFGLLDRMAVYRDGENLIPLDTPFYLAFQIGFYFLVMLLPVLLGFLLLKKTEGQPPIAPVKPVAPGVFFGYFFIGTGIFTVGNFVSSVIVGFAESFGVAPKPVTQTVDGTPLNLLLNLFAMAVMPAVLEELLFRGVIVGLLRPLGDRTAILISALVFAFAHGTLNQIPFAFLLGLAFAYFYIRTDNILLLILLHFVNNAVSVMLDFALCHLSEPATVALQYLLFGGMTVAGAIAVWLLAYHDRRLLLPIGDKQDRLPHAQAWPRAVFAPASLAFFIWMIIETLSSLSFGTGV